MNWEIESNSPDETRMIGELFGKLLKGGETVCLYGDLGAGKTCLAQGIIKGAGVAYEEYPRSPTFSLINKYSGRFDLYHIDLYRLEREEDLYEIGLEELLRNSETLFIEWPERLGSLKPTNSIDVAIHSPDERKRVLVFTACEAILSEIRKMEPTNFSVSKAI